MKVRGQLDDPAALLLVKNPLLVEQEIKNVGFDVWTAE